MSEHLYFKGRTRLTFATLSGDADGVRRLLESSADPNRPNDRGDYALILATTNNNPDVVQTLLRAGASPNETDSTGRSALQLAARYGYWQIVEILGGRRPAPRLAQLRYITGIFFRIYDSIRS